MINYNNYTSEEIDKIYSLVENSIKNKTPINLSHILNILKPGDFYLEGSSSTGLTFQFNGLKWIKNGKIYICLIQPQSHKIAVSPSWIPIISVEEKCYLSSGDLSMIKKENRYIQTL